ncbi:aldo-keto reductase family 1 member C1 homolog [Rhinatrema bivittatum]|uniref:aldo-keto reductase family 1 member C1 homolog n=1 Tax=Rhinatrema bivittatum TaxID=194408 RepID=UPI00112ED0AF|nr:aldo-keto reductase family 1 member C1 homolog [Rhinatrema bivittatum]
MSLCKDSCITMSDGHKIPIIALGTFSPPFLPKYETSDTIKVTSEAGYGTCGNDDAQENTERAAQKTSANGAEKVLSTEKTLKDQVKEAIKLALKVGYRHIDGAYIYGNEEYIGPAIQEKIADGTVKREDIFYTGKLWNTFHKPEFVQTALKRTLKSLQLDYIDLYIIHWPVSFKFGEDPMPFNESGKIIFEKVDLCAVWEAMEACKDAGLVKSIGVSNFNRRQLEMILNKPMLKYKPVCNQVECHPYLTQKKLQKFCKMNDIVFVAYSVLGAIRVDTEWRNQHAPAMLEDPVMTMIAQKYNKSPAQVSIRYILQCGNVAIAKSFNAERIKENFQVFDFELTEEDMKLIDGLNKNIHYWEVKEFGRPP